MAIGNAEKRYKELENVRDTFLRRAQDCSKITIPSLIPENTDQLQSFPTPFQSVGARGVNNLASKLMLTLFPSNYPFVRLRVDNLILEQAQDDKFRTEIEEGLSKIEQLIMGDMASGTDRVVIFEGIKHLVVGGNCLFYVPVSGNMRCFPLNKYVMKRDPSGNVLEVIVKESVSTSALPADLAKVIKAEKGEGKDFKAVDLFTYLKRDGDIYKIFQECKGLKIPGSDGVYPIDSCPWIPVRFIRVDGEDYGRGYVEEYLGDLLSLEALSQAIVEGTAAASKVIFLINPNGMTSDKDLAETPNCGFAAGLETDVSVVQVQKHADFRVAQETIARLTQQLSYAFLMNMAVQRQAERVTAEEIRLMAEDLETALGGVYSLLAEELQLPYAAAKLMKLQRQGKMDKLPKDVVKPAIVTGIDALGRSSDKAKLLEFLQSAAAVFGPEAVAQYINPLDGLGRLAASLGLNKKGLVKTEEEIQAQMQQAQMQQMMAQLGPESIKQVGGMIQKGMDGGM